MTTTTQMLEAIKCPICACDSTAKDVVDFNKSCVAPNGNSLPLSGIPIYYYLCGNCQFCFAPEFWSWSPEEFSKKIYNDRYIDVDPGYADSRPRENANTVASLFPNFPASARHLDYGGGNGLLSSLLRNSGWNSSSYEPFGEYRSVPPDGQFDLITAFEVFEHVPHPRILIDDLVKLSKADGIILFSTLVSDENLNSSRIEWWYASPRNGHISLFSQKSLELAADIGDFAFGSFSPGLHIFIKGAIPEWASHIFRFKQQ